MKECLLVDSERSSNYGLNHALKFEAAKIRPSKRLQEIRAGTPIAKQWPQAERHRPDWWQHLEVGFLNRNS
jgi:hypothetical protein